MPRLILLLAFSFAAQLAVSAQPETSAERTEPPAERHGDVYVVDASLPVHPLDAHAEVLADSTGELDFAAARRVGRERWRPAREASVPYSPRYTGGHLPLGPHAYFYRVALRTPEALTGWQLHLEDRLHGNIAWIRGNGRAEVRAYRGEELLWSRTTGADVAPAERDLAGPRTLDRVRADGLPAATDVELIARLEPNALGFPAFANASLRAPGYLNYHPLYPRSVLFNAFVFGVAAIMLVAHLLLFVYLRERVYLWFSVWLAFGALTHAMTIGVEPADWLPLRHPDLRFFVWLVVPSTMLFTAWLFGRSFVGTAAKYPRLDRAMLALPLAMAGVVVVQLVYVALYDPPRPFTALPGFYLAIAGFAAAGLVLGIVLATRRGDTLARYFGAGAIVASAFLVLAGLWAQRIVRLPFDPFAAGLLAQVVVYSFGLAYRQQVRARRAQADALAAERARGEVARMRDLDELKARFFANVSHEFRTPLALIEGHLDRARSRAAEAHGSKPAAVALAAEEYGVVRENAARLVELVEQLLELSRLEHGGVSLALEPGDPVAHVHHLVAAFDSLAEGAGIRLDAQVGEGCAEGYYDADKLTKIVSNLLANAVKYTPSGGAVTVTAACDGDTLSLEVSDTGPGIPDEELARVFDRFYRVEGSEARGAGIGLALVRELVALHGGEVSVASAVGAGSTFSVRLPVVLAALPTQASVESPSREAAGAQSIDGAAAPIAPPASSAPVPVGPDAAGDSPTPSEGERATVLLVEDNDQLRRFVAELLAERGYAVLAAADGREGERLATDRVPDLVLSDVMMPGQDGYALCHALKTNPKTSHVPVILLTARADAPSRRAGLTQGADAYVEKPFDAEELALRIRNLLAARERLWAHFRRQDLTLLPDVDARSLDDQFVQAVAAAIAERLGDEALDVDAVAQAVGYSRSQLTRKLRALTGKTPVGLITDMRLAEAHRQLERACGTVSEVAYRVGYANPSYFAKRFRERYGVPPSEVLAGQTAPRAAQDGGALTEA